MEKAMNRMTTLAAFAAALLILQACSTSSPVQHGALDCEGLTRVPSSSLAGVCVQGAHMHGFLAGVHIWGCMHTYILD